MNIQEQIQKSEEEFNELGAIFSFPHNAVNAKAEIPQRDGFPMIYNGMYITHDLKLWHSNSIKSILEGLVEREKNGIKENPTPKWNAPKNNRVIYAHSRKSGYNNAKQDTISHLQSLIKSLEE